MSQLIKELLENPTKENLQLVLSLCEDMQDTRKRYAQVICHSLLPNLKLEIEKEKELNSKIENLFASLEKLNVTLNDYNKIQSKIDSLYLKKDKLQANKTFKCLCNTNVTFLKLLKDQL